MGRGRHSTDQAAGRPLSRPVGYQFPFPSGKLRLSDIAPRNGPTMPTTKDTVLIDEFLPPEVADLDNPQTAIPAIAKDVRLMALIEEAVSRVPTRHELHLQDARKMNLAPESVHLVVTSPPYWTLKRYRESEGQLGHHEDYEGFLLELDKVWRRCFKALVPGGRLICVVGDVCLSRRKNQGRHTVVPLHASIQEHCRKLGFDNLAPIIWHKIANAQYEVDGNGGSFLGKPYEPNSVIKNDIEFILMERKPGGTASRPSPRARSASFRKPTTEPGSSRYGRDSPALPRETIRHPTRSSWPNGSSACSASSAIRYSTHFSGPAPPRSPP